MDAWTSHASVPYPSTILPLVRYAARVCPLCVHRASLAAAPLTVNKAAVSGGLVTQAEYEQIVAWLSESLPFESQGRVRQVQLIARSHAITAAQKLGRSGATMALLRAIASPLPRLWEALNEQEENGRNMEEDLLLDDGAFVPLLHSTTTGG